MSVPRCSRTGRGETMPRFGSSLLFGARRRRAPAADNNIRKHRLLNGLECDILNTTIGKERSLMAELESQQTTTGFPGKPGPQRDAKGIGAFSPSPTQAASD